MGVREPPAEIPVANPVVLFRALSLIGGRLVTDPKNVALVEVRVGSTNQLFDTFDPTPYPRKDLAQPTENFIVDWARELPRKQAIKIVVYLPTRECESAAARQIDDAFSNYFQYRADRSRLDRKELFRVGFWSMIIGVGRRSLPPPSVVPITTQLERAILT